jgi:Flp pilus assembly protein protease CpaA
MMSPEDFAYVRDCLLLVTLGVALYTDLTRGKVYNWCTFPAILIGLVLNYVAGAVDTTAQGNALAELLGGPLMDGLQGLALALGIFGLAYLFHMLGGGDVKLMCAIGAIQGLAFFMLAALATACAGAVVAVAVLIWRGRLREGLKGSLRAATSPRKFRERQRSAPPDAPEMITIPYVGPIVFGAVCAMLFKWLSWTV